MKRDTIYILNRKHLIETIEKEIKEQGYGADLNHLDVSQVDNFSAIFGIILNGGFGFKKFNGDISQWDVSSALTMQGMFFGSDFNGSLEQWDVSRVVDFNMMFAHSTFNRPLTNWNPMSARTMIKMFEGSKFNQSIAHWKCPHLRSAVWMFSDAAFDQDFFVEGCPNDPNLRFERSEMFYNSGWSQKLGTQDPSLEEIRAYQLAESLEKTLTSSSVNLDKKRL